MEFSTNEVVARAIELWDAQRARDNAAEERSYAAEALAELNIPPEYLEKARAELDGMARQKRLSRRTRTLKFGVMLGACLACLLLLQAFHPYAFGAWESSFSAPHAWQLHENPGTDAQVTRGEDNVGGESLWLEVRAFALPADGRYFANVRARNPPRTLWGREEMTLSVRGKGGLQATRVYLRSGANERWRSPRIPLTSAWVEHRIPIEGFERQTGGRAEWEPAPWETPVGITMLQLKVGYNINELEATGALGLQSIRFD